MAPSPVAADQPVAQATHPATADIIPGMPENVAGMLSYFVFPAIIFLFVQPFSRNRFVRFHCFQCLITMGVLLVVHLFLALLARALPLVVLPLFGLLLLAELTLLLLLLMKTYQGERFKLPIIGDLAEARAETI